MVVEIKWFGAVWGAQGWETFLCEGRMNSDTYISILSNVLEPSVKKIFHTKRHCRYIFQQDNAPCHKSAKSMAFLKKKNICTMNSPPQSPDLNPIENLWTMVKIEIAKYSPSSKKELFEIVQREWEKFSKLQCENLIKTMPKRVKAVLKAKGMATKY